jgi:hypothetical protein
MTRLYSFVGLYSFVFGAPIFSVTAFISMYIYSYNTLLLVLIPVGPIMLYWLFTFRRWKKVYYEGESLYIYNLFSNDPIVVHKENLDGINRLMFYDPRFYKIVYYDENKDAKFIYFQRNWFLDDFTGIIDKLNE